MRTGAFFLLLLLPAACALRAQDDASKLAEAREAHRTGKYDRAVALYREIAGAPREPNAASVPPASAVEARRALVRVLAEVGKYAEAEETGRRFAADPAVGAQVANALGEALVARGKLAAAESAFTRAVAGRATDSLTARLNLALVDHQRGRRAEALRKLDAFIDVYNERRARLTSEELMAIGTACRYLGAESPQLFKDALKALDEAVAADSTNLEAQVRIGELFLEKYNSPDAAAAFSGVLRVNPAHPRALLGSARRRHFDGQPGAADLVKKALETNPSLVAAHAFQAQQALDVEDFDGAVKAAQQALAVDPGALEPLSIVAVAHYLKGDKARFEAARTVALQRDSSFAGFYVTLAEIAARGRQYGQAVEFAKQGRTLDPKSWRAHAVLGVNQLRVGAIEDGRKSLETAFAGDPYDVWTKNTLDLLDTFKDYRETATPNFRLFIGKGESDLLSIYLGEMAEQAYAQFSQRYGYRTAGPVRLEVYRSHADFSVRTVGLAGLGALGVSFGEVLAMDAPSARPVGEFNWGSTAWHEIAHTFTLGASGHRVPRWLSEGLSVLEERRARPGWGQDVSPEFLAYVKRGRMLPPSKLNDGFMRPRWPGEVMLAYYEASLVAELIERDFGAKAIGDMLRAYRDTLTTEQVFQRVLKVDLAEFDKRFDRYVREKFKGPLAALKVTEDMEEGGDQAPDSTGRRPRPRRVPRLAVPSADDPSDWASQLVRGRELYDDGKRDEAVPYLERAKALFPEYGGDDSPYWFLAQIYQSRGDSARAVAELAKLTALSETNYQANLLEADLREKLGDKPGAAAALERAMWISPYEQKIHARLAALYAAAGDKAKAVRERRAVLALAPVDMADALYQLALAQFEAGDAAAARRTVLQALERAPSFEAAQELLLKVRP